MQSLESPKNSKSLETPKSPKSPKGLKAFRNLKILLQDTLAKHKRTVHIIITLFCAALLSLAVIQIVSLNARYPSPTILEASLNEEITGGDIGITVTGFHIYEGKEIYEVSPDYTTPMSANGEPRPIEQVRMFIWDITITNYGSETQQVALYEFVIRIGLWHGSLNPYVYTTQNEGYGMTREIAPGEQIQAYLPYTMFTTIFNEQQWERMLQGSIDLVRLKYPVEIVIHGM